MANCLQHYNVINIVECFSCVNKSKDTIFRGQVSIPYNLNAVYKTVNLSQIVAFNLAQIWLF